MSEYLRLYKIRTVYPDEIKERKPTMATIGEIKSFWTNNGDGHFNMELYIRITQIRIEYNYGNTKRFFI